MYVSLQYLYACIHRRTVPNHTLSATIPGLLRCLDPNKLNDLQDFSPCFHVKNHRCFLPRLREFGNFSTDFPKGFRPSDMFSQEVTILLHPMLHHILALVYRWVYRITLNDCRILHGFPRRTCQLSYLAGIQGARQFFRSIATRILLAFESTRTLPQSSNKWKSSLWMCRSWVKSHGTFRSSPGSSRWVSRPHLHPSPTCRRTCRNPEALHQSQCNLHLLLWPEDHPNDPNGKPNTPSTKNGNFYYFMEHMK